MAGARMAIGRTCLRSFSNVQVVVVVLTAFVVRSFENSDIRNVSARFVVYACGRHG